MKTNVLLHVSNNNYLTHLKQLDNHTFPKPVLTKQIGTVLFLKRFSMHLYLDGGKITPNQSLLGNSLAICEAGLILQYTNSRKPASMTIHFGLA